MHETLKVSRRKIDSNSMNLLNSMIDDLKQDQKFIRLTSSKLNDWIINRFYNSYYSKDKSRIISDHFLKREYFKSILNDLDDSMDLESMMKTMQKKIKKAQQTANKASTITPQITAKNAKETA